MAIATTSEAKANPSLTSFRLAKERLNILFSFC
jgi:hypothetical protein